MLAPRAPLDVKLVDADARVDLMPTWLHFNIVDKRRGRNEKYSIKLHL